MDTLTGETPQNYFATFKRMIETATDEGYFKKCPSDNVDLCNTILTPWIKRITGKYITWSCLRLSCLVWLQDENVTTAIVSYIPGHKTTKQVESHYKRHRPLNPMEAILKLPMPGELPYYLLLNKNEV